ncbi:hypothetical protein AG1IA_03439 [Rhizoctonia solani AG-1 IA]|uniref:Uncharacterized protein n=1 Tax=Thanatephorus cucumeris (strain AG1-IA) TaxID=983506 RepID=L8X1N5_THACA|nr:hypothetical protein AG1IA_03439 [Rhizoctonia solani AG-1 IA]
MYHGHTPAYIYCDSLQPGYKEAINIAGRGLNGQPVGACIHMSGNNTNVRNAGGCWESSKYGMVVSWGWNAIII